MGGQQQNLKDADFRRIFLNNEIEVEVESAVEGDDNLEDNRCLTSPKGKKGTKSTSTTQVKKKKKLWVKKKNPKKVCCKQCCNLLVNNILLLDNCCCWDKQ